MKAVTTIRKEYIVGEIPTMEAPAPTYVGEDIVYSPNKYRETEGGKDRYRLRGVRQTCNL